MDAVRCISAHSLKLGMHGCKYMIPVYLLHKSHALDLFALSVNILQSKYYVHMSKIQSLG